MQHRIAGYAGTWAPSGEGARRDWLRREAMEPTPASDGPAEPAADFQSACVGPLAFQEGGIRVVVRGRPTVRAINTTFGGSTDPLRAIVATYRTAGERFVEAIEGAFAIALIDARRRRVILAVDRLGMERMTYATPEGGLVFSDSATAVARFPGVSAGIRAQSVFDYLFAHMVPAPNTIFEGVRKLPAASRLVYEDGKARVETWWRPRFVEGRSPDSFTDLRDELHTNLEAAVSACRPDAATGAFLSGGLDSSTVAGMLGRVRGETADTYSIGFGVDAYDELEFARTTVEHFGCRSHEYHVSPADIVSTFDRIAAAYDEPFGNSSAIPTYFCARLAHESGTGHLLAGDGGDEIFGGNERYARHQVFDAWYRIPAVVRRALIEPAAKMISASSSITPLRKIRSYVDQAKIPLPERLESWNFIYRSPLGDMLEPDFQKCIDPRGPFKRMQEVYESAPCQSVLNRMLYYDWFYTLADNDLRKVGTMCELAGVKVSYPMLDTRVVELSARVPPQLKMKRLELRTFYKRAMRGFLPDKVIAKKKHGFGLPFGVWLKTDPPLANLIRGHLEDLKRRGIVRASFIDDLLVQHRDGHPSYFGYPIWALAMLEAWFKAHVD
jgi:asparagine synthase (glutamine-hydrolysing)